MLNHIVIMGRMARDPELRRTGSGIAVASFAVAVERDIAAQGQEKETDFIDCVAWRKTGEFVSKYFTKGSMIVVSGRLQIRCWTDKEGNKRRSAEVVADNCYFGSPKNEGTPPQPAAAPPEGEPRGRAVDNRPYGGGDMRAVDNRQYGGVEADHHFQYVEDDDEQLPF